MTVTADSIVSMLRFRHQLPEWILALNVANGTGGNARRWADAVAMNCFPSKGLEIVGYEIKVARSDWLRELKDSEKAVPVADYCDRWYIVAPEGVVKKEELPKAWGLMVASGGLRISVNVPARDDAKAVNRTFMASMIRCLAKADDQAMKDAERRGRDAGYKEARERGSFDGGIKDRLDALVGKVRTFQEASGVEIANGWDLGDVGAKIKALRESGRVPAEALQFARRLRSTAESLEAAFAGLDEEDADRCELTGRGD